jgi:glycosyltransferase involved in cell wall biosynthesis
MVDVIIPTILPPERVRAQVAQIHATAGVPVNVIATCQQASAAINRNYGLARARSDIIFMLDDDITGLPEDWAVRMIEAMASNPRCVMCSPRLLNLDGTMGIMAGFPTKYYEGCEVLGSRELLTAFIAIRNTSIRFDVNYIGSGFEDNDYCRQLVVRFPDAEFICIHDLLAVHRNEKKNQHGEYWQKNKRYFQRKWARKSVVPKHLRVPIKRTQQTTGVRP